MPSQVVDAMWHEFICTTKAYQDWWPSRWAGFCNHTRRWCWAPRRKNNDGLRRRLVLGLPRRVHQAGCATRLPLLFALDAKLQIANGFHYVPTAATLRARMRLGRWRWSLLRDQFSDGFVQWRFGSFGGMESSDGGFDGGGSDGGGDGGGWVWGRWGLTSLSDCSGGLGLCRVVCRLAKRARARRQTKKATLAGGLHANREGTKIYFSPSNRQQLPQTPADSNPAAHKSPAWPAYPVMSSVRIVIAQSGPAGRTARLPLFHAQALGW